MYEPGDAVVRSGRAGVSAHTEIWYAGPDWEVILRKSPSGNSLRAVCLGCFSSPTLLFRPPHNSLKRMEKICVLLKYSEVLYNVYSISIHQEEFTLKQL